MRTLRKPRAIVVGLPFMATKKRLTDVDYAIYGDRLAQRTGIKKARIIYAG